MTEIDVLVTDSGLADETAARFAEAGVKVMRA